MVRRRRREEQTPPLLRDLNSEARTPVDLRREVGAIVPPPSAPKPGGMTVRLDGSGGSRLPAGSLWRWALRRASRVATRPVPKLPETAVVVAFAPRALPDAPAAPRSPLPAIVALAVVILITLGSVATIELRTLYQDVRARTASALAFSRDGIAALRAADPALAAEQFHSAAKLLAEADERLNDASVHSALRTLSPAEQSGALVRAAQATATAGAAASTALSAARARAVPTALTELGRFLAAVDAADTAFQQAGTLRADVAPIANEIATLRASTAELRRLYPIILAALGGNGPRRYLLLFQNTAELRGSGGFLGSFALLELDQLQVQAFTFHDVYEIDWKQHADVAPPEGLARYYQSMRLRDSNYSPDFPSAAEWVERFYEGAGGTTVDGVIAVDSELFGDLLDALGPFTLPGTTTTLTRENFHDLLTMRIETSKQAPDGPKGVLRDLMPTLTAAMLDPSNWQKLGPIVERAAAEKHLLATVKDVAVRAELERLLLTGAFPAPPTSEDELAIVSTNVGGNKSDRFTTLSATHHAHIRADGSIGLTLELEKRFTLPDDFETRIAPLLAGKKGEELAYLRHVLGDSTNKDYLRIYLPRGTTVRTVTGVVADDWHVREELGRTVLGIHLATQVGETRSLGVLADLPFQLDFVANATYRFRAIKQPGVATMHLQHEVTVDPGLTILGANGDTIKIDLTGTTDASHAAVVTRV